MEEEKIKEETLQSPEILPVKKKKPWLIIIFIVLFLISIGTIGFFVYQNYFLKKQRPIKDNTQASNQNKFPISSSRTISNDKIIPIDKNDNILYFYSLTDKKFLSNSYKIPSYSFESGKGMSSPMWSPNGHYTAFINADEDNKLYLFQNNLELKKLTEYPVKFLADWSPDSKKILYFVDDDKLECRKINCEGMGGTSKEWQGREKFYKGAYPGFHILDIESGLDTLLFPLKKTQGFISNNQVSAITQEGNNDRLVVLNIDTLDADFSLVNFITSGLGNFSFTSDGRYWTFDYSNDPMLDTNIIYAEFPNKEGIVLESGHWSEFQHPKINHNGNYIAYEKWDGTINTTSDPNSVINFVKIRIWDTGSKKMIKEFEGRLWRWLDDKSILFTQLRNNPNNIDYYAIYHLNTNQIETLK